MSNPKSTKLTMHEDWPTGVSSAVHGANLDTIGFNIAFIATRNPRLAVAILKLYAEARDMRASDPKAPEEDFALFAEQVAKLLATNKGDD